MGDPDAFWRQTPRTLTLALRGGWARVRRDQDGLRFLGWHMLAPHGGKAFPTLAEYMGAAGGGAAKAKPKPALDVDTAMRKWVAVTTFAQAQRAAPRKSSARSKLEV